MRVMVVIKRIMKNDTVRCFFIIYIITIIRITGSDNLYKGISLCDSYH